MIALTWLELSRTSAAGLTWSKCSMTYAITPIRLELTMAETVMLTSLNPR